LRSRKRTGFLLGVLAGIPPCIFEIGIYTYASLTSISNGWGNGVWIVFFFGIGTWLGLIPLAILGTMSGKVSKFLQKTSFTRLNFKFKKKKEIDPLESETDDDIITDSEQKFSIFNLEILSAAFMVTMGIVFFILAILNINIIPIDEVPGITWPFNEDNVQYFWLGAFILFLLAVLTIMIINHVKKSKVRVEDKFMETI